MRTVRYAKRRVVGYLAIGLTLGALAWLAERSSVGAAVVDFLP